MAYKPKCKTFKKVKDNSLQSAKNWLISQDLSDALNNIKDLVNFRKAAQYLKELANKKGYFPDLLVYDIEGGKKVAYNIPAFKKLDGINAQIEKKAALQPELFQKQTNSSEGQMATEKTIRDLAARMSDRIGIPFRIISDRTQQFKGKIDENGRAIVNLAYATLDSAVHEIAGHGIIRTLKNKSEKTEDQYIKEMIDGGEIIKEC